MTNDMNPTVHRRDRDPMVPLDIPSLKAAIEWRGITPTQLATQAGISKQSLDHHLKRSGRRRCHQQVRRRLAKRLGVSEAWLGGERHQLSLDMWPGREFLYSRLTAMAAQDLLDECEAACARDTAQMAESDRPTPENLEVRRRTIREAVLRLIRIGLWRVRVLEGWAPDGVTLEPRDYDPLAPVDQRKPDPEHEAALIALVKVWSHILRPWFTGQAKLDVAGLEALAGRDEQPSGPYAYLPIAASSSDTTRPTKSKLKSKRLMADEGDTAIPWPLRPPRKAQPPHDGSPQEETS